MRRLAGPLLVLAVVLIVLGLALIPGIALLSR